MPSNQNQPQRPPQAPQQAPQQPPQTINIPLDIFPEPEPLKTPEQEPVDLLPSQLPLNGKRVNLTPYEIVYGKQWDGILGAAVTAGFFGLILFFPLWLITPRNALTLVLAFSALAFFVIIAACLTDVDGQQLKVFVHKLKPRTLVLFQSGGAVRQPWMAPFRTPTIDLQAHKDASRAVTVITREGIPIVVNMRTNGKPAEEYIKNFLLYAPEVIEQIIMGLITDRLQRLFALNSWRTLTAHRDKVFQSIGNIFGAADVMTPAEEKLGWLVISNRSEGFGPEPGRGEKLFQTIFEAELLPRVTEGLRKANPNASDEDILQTARKMVDKEIRENRTIISASPGITTVATGDSGLAVSGARGGNP